MLSPIDNHPSTCAKCCIVREEHSLLTGADRVSAAWYAFPQNGGVMAVYTTGGLSSNDLDHPRELEREAPCRAYLFGYLRIYRGDQRLTLETSRKKGLHILLWFLLNPGKPCSADQFVETLWPEAEPGKAISGFDVNMHALKRLLEPELGPREQSSFIQHHANRVYTFESANMWWTDVADLELLYQRGHACDNIGDIARARFYYRRVSEYVSQGPLLDGESSPWLERYRHRYTLMCSQALTRLMQIDIDCGADEDLLESAYQMLRLDRYNQLANRVIIEASLRNGNPSRARRRLEAYCDAVERDLGVEPPKDFDELRRQLVGTRVPRNRTLRPANLQMR
ncbi:BTAD domain-containing putative transcriptional regulator [Nocardia sp. CDC153]|uniref:AfsR/SARP family transcriptional regulator n=1 Tax=Nocardia sp. CDC153 TaxID=3112167 RepID=UPI002DBC5C99|nr:BTAD domain-containing putative transcriptional regulator [Nocardia sp. CDC153]MEC3957787.1 BTAD domain-containing putative transcriptional regulator [Nocardia sp. CDC153]